MTSDVVLLAEEATALLAALEGAVRDTRIEGKTPWEFACEWYRPDETERCIQQNRRNGERRIPEDVHSREFAEWLTDQYRLAMNKGIQIGQQKTIALARIAAAVELVVDHGRASDFRAYSLGETKVSSPQNNIQDIIGRCKDAPVPPQAEPVRAEPITVAWLHSVRPDGWLIQPRGISHCDWSIHSIQSRPRNVPVDDWTGYDAGPFVWSFTPTHDANMRPLDKHASAHCTVLVLESRADVLTLFRLLDREVKLEMAPGRLPGYGIA